MKFEVLVSSWNGYAGGVHEEARPSKELIRHLAGAEAAGAVRVLDERSKIAGHVQSQADGEKAYAKAVESGDWHEGNLAQYEQDVKTGNRDANDPLRVPAAEAGS